MPKNLRVLPCVLLPAILSATAPCSAAAQSEDNAFATQVWVNPGIYSYHFDRDKDFRSDNVGFGVEVALKPEHRALAGSFINSDYTRTRYVAWNWRPLNWKPGGVDVSAGIIAGAFDGYPRYRNGAWFAAAMPVVSVEGERFGVNVSILPNIPNRISGAVAVQFKLRAW
jgi:hypothetical protein